MLITFPFLPQIIQTPLRRTATQTQLRQLVLAPSPIPENFLKFSRKANKEYFLVPVERPPPLTKLQLPEGRARSPVGTFGIAHYAPILTRACPPRPRHPPGLVVGSRVPGRSRRRLARPLSALRPCRSPSQASALPTPTPPQPPGANLLRSRGHARPRGLAAGLEGRGASPDEVPCPRSGRLFGCCRHLMATRVEEAARGRGGGGAEEATEAGRGGRRRSPRQKVSWGGVHRVAERAWGCSDCLFGVHLFDHPGYL